MRYLLDTNVVSELRKGARANAHVRAWAASADPDAVFLSALTIGEARRGVERVRRRDAGAAMRLEVWLEGLMRDYADRILPLDAQVAERWGRIGVPDPVPTIDGLLAATALTHGLVLVTRNTRDFARTGVELLDPFAPFGVAER